MGKNVVEGYIEGLLVLLNFSLYQGIRNRNGFNLYSCIIFFISFEQFQYRVGYFVSKWQKQNLNLENRDIVILFQFRVFRVEMVDR